MKKRKLLCLILVLSLFLTACGNKDIKVEDYGSGESSGKSSEAKANAGDSLIEMLGGKELSYSNSFNLGDTACEMNVNYTVKDTDSLCIYNVELMTEDDVKENEIVKKIFGETGKAIKTEDKSLLNKDEDSSGIIDVINSICSANSDPDNTHVHEAVPWLDEDSYYVHTYEGKYNGLDYQLVVSYCSKFNQMAVALFPKKYSDIVGDPALEDCYMSYRDGNVYLYNPGLHTVNLNEVMSDRPNKCTLSDEELINTTSKTLKDFLNVDYPPESISFYSNANSLGIPEVEDPQKNELVYLNDDIMNSDTLEGAVRDGYDIPVMYTICNQYIRTGTPYVESMVLQSGDVYLNNSGVIAFRASTNYIFGERVTENTSVLSFKDAMDTFVNESSQDIDPKELSDNTGSLIIDAVQFVYVPITLDDGTMQLIPSWEISIRSTSRLIAVTYINAIDGSHINTLSAEDLGY